MYAHACSHIVGKRVMSGTAEVPIVLDSDSDEAENETPGSTVDSENEVCLPEVTQTKGSPLKLICTKRHR